MKNIPKKFKNNSNIFSILTVILSFSTGVVFPQSSVTGKIYGQNAPLIYIKISNISQGIVANSNEQGFYKINAVENDTISFVTIQPLNFFQTKV